MNAMRTTGQEERERRTMVREGSPVRSLKAALSDIFTAQSDTDRTEGRHA
jgi:hypothetical protein